MPEYIKVSVGNDSADLDMVDSNSWRKQLTAPGMPGEYKMKLEIRDYDGSTQTLESPDNLTVTGKFFDLGQYGKINERLIRRFVLTLSGRQSHVVFKDSTIYVFVIMDEDDSVMFERIERILLPKIPAHLKLSVRRYSNIWNKLLYDFRTWDDVKVNFATWDEVCDYVPKHKPVEPLKGV